MINKKPKDLQEIHFWDYDEDQPDQDLGMPCLYSIQTNQESKSKVLCTTNLWINKDQTLEHLHDELRKRCLTLKKKNGEEYQNMYECTLEDLISAAETVLLEGLPEDEEAVLKAKAEKEGKRLKKKRTGTLRMRVSKKTIGHHPPELDDD